MAFIALLVVHVAAALVALASGYLALVVKKGSANHRLSGNVFCATMGVMALSAIGLATPKMEVVNMVAGGFTVYLVATGWMTIKRPAGTHGRAEAAQLAFGLTLGLGALAWSWRTAGAMGPVDLAVVIPCAVFGLLALFAAGLDARVLTKGGIIGPARVARHIWRLCLALLVNATSTFTPTRFSLPVVLTATHLNLMPILYLVLATIFWMYWTLRRPRQTKGFSIKAATS